MTFSNNPEKLSLFGGGCNENDRILDLYGGLISGHDHFRQNAARDLAKLTVARVADRH